METIRLLVPTDRAMDISSFIPKHNIFCSAIKITHVVVYDLVEPGEEYLTIPRLDNVIYNLADNDGIIIPNDTDSKWDNSVIKLDEPISLNDSDRFYYRHKFVKNTHIKIPLTKTIDWNEYVKLYGYKIRVSFDCVEDIFNFSSSPCHTLYNYNVIQGVIIEYNVKLPSKPQDVLMQYEGSLLSKFLTNSIYDNHPSDTKSDEDYKLTSHNIKEDKQMEKKVFGKSYGPINDVRIAMDISGQLVFAPHPETDNKLSYKKFDQKTGKVVDMLDNVIALKAGLVYSVPVNVSDIEKGDVIINDDDWYAVKSVTKDHIIKGINLKDSTMLDIVPQSIMGSDMGFVTKIINLMNPGKLDPMLIMMVMNNDEEEETMDTKTAMLMMMMNNNGGATNNNMNMLLPMMLLGDDDDKSSTMLMLMMMNQNGGCNCGGMNMNNMLPMLMLGKDFDKKDMLMLMMMMQNNNQNQQKIDPPANKK